MKINARWLLLTIIMFIALLGLELGIAAISIKPEQSELLTLGGFLLFFGGITLIASAILGRTNLPSWIHSIRTQLIIISVIIAILAGINIGFVAYLMFISPHDLGLLIGLIVFSLGLSVITSFYLSKPTIKNIHQVIGAICQINAGNLEQTVPVISKDEIGELAMAFNSMLKRLKESLQRERDMEKARRELIEAVSHDLRTPISSIRAMIESINDGVVTDEATIKRYLRTAQSEIEDLGQLVNDLFELSQIDAGLLELHIDSVSLQKLIPDTLETMSAEAASRQLKLAGEVAEGLPPVSIDQHRVKRVLYNLVQNAIRHTPADGSIRIQAKDSGKEVEIEVADTGEGITTKDLPRVFERSYRSDQSRSRQSGGAGLGLAISKGIVEAHGGRIWAKSKPGQAAYSALLYQKPPPEKLRLNTLKSEKCHDYSTNR